MWVMTRYGFFSIVCVYKADGTPHPTKMLLRARKRTHLERLQAFYDGLGAIVETGMGDYPFSIVVHTITASRLIAELGADIDYESLPDAAPTRLVDAEYKEFLQSVTESGIKILQNKK